MLLQAAKIVGSGIATVGLAGAGMICLKWYNNYSIFYDILILITLLIFTGKYRFYKIIKIISFSFYKIININIKILENIYNNLIEIFVFWFHIIIEESFISFKKILLYNEDFCSNEGEIERSEIYTLNSSSNIINNETSLCGKFKRLNSYERIGPHNIDILSIIIGSVLGDGYLEKRKSDLGTRIRFEQCSRNVEYLMWFHNYLSIRGYCNSKKPTLRIRIRKNEKIYFSYSTRTYSFTSFNWLRDMFYIFDLTQNKWKKIVPINIGEYLTPLALAIWFMDDGSKKGSSVSIATNYFSEKEILFLSETIKTKYGIISSKVSSGVNKGYSLYIHKNSLPLFSSIIKPYIVPSMYYKLHGY